MDTSEAGYSSFRLSTNADEQRITLTIFHDGLTWVTTKGFVPHPHRKVDLTWELHLRVPFDRAIILDIHETLPIPPALPSLSARLISSWTIHPHRSPVPQRIAARVPLATEDRVYEVYLYRDEPAWRRGRNWVEERPSRIAMPTSAVLPPNGVDYAPARYRDGALMGLRDVEQGFLWHRVHRWRDGVVEGVAPEQEKRSAAEVEREEAARPYAEGLVVGDTYRELEGRQRWGEQDEV